jgi:hypothetical protein
VNIVTQKTPAGWQAIDEDSYDPAPENRDELIGGEVGRGNTEQESIDDLCDQLGLNYSMKAEDAA